MIVQSGLHSIERVTKKVKDIVTYFKKSSHGLSKLQDLQRQTRSSILKLKQDCPTRWNSTYDMLDRIFELKEPILWRHTLKDIKKLYLNTFFNSTYHNKHNQILHYQLYFEFPIQYH